MPKKQSYTTAEIIDALQQAKGYVSKAASILKCTPMTVYNYRSKYPTVAEAWDSIREERHDFVENALHKRIQAGSDTAIIFYLKTQAKERGYVERQEVHHTVTWQDKVVDALRQGKLKPEMVRQRWGDELAKQFFKQAGVNVESTS